PAAGAAGDEQHRDKRDHAGNGKRAERARLPRRSHTPHGPPPNERPPPRKIFVNRSDRLYAAQFGLVMGWYPTRFGVHAWYVIQSWPVPSSNTAWPPGP